MRPNRKTIIQLRAYMLLFIKELVTKENGIQQEELQALLNYLHTVNEVSIYRKNANFSINFFNVRVKI